MKIKKRLIFYLILFICASFVVIIGKTGKADKSITITDCFDTVSEITVCSKSNKPLNDCKGYMMKIEKELSHTDTESLLYKYNSGDEVSFSEDAKEIISIGDKFTSAMPDYFSIYLNSLIKAWNIPENTGTIPDVSSPLLDAEKKNGINLGGILKGFVTDKLVEILKKDGVESALINLGGNAYAIGKKSTGENWKIGIQSPKDQDKTIGIVTCENLAVVTSGDYERFFEKDGVRYHHIFDPKTGFPANNGLHSVTIISENATLSDALSTAVFVSGLESGIELLKQYEVMGILVTDDTVYFSKSLENIFKQTDFSYKYEFIN